MRVNRPDRTVRVLAAVTAVAFYGLLVGFVVVLIGLALVRVLAAGNTDWYFGMAVPTVVMDTDVSVLTRWGDARLEVEEAHGSLRLPIGLLPWWLFGLLWVHTLVAGSVMLLFLDHLRRILQRVRDGIPFDAANALALRRLGGLLLALAVINGVAGLVASVAVRSGLADDAVRIPAGLSVDMSLVFAAFLLFTLAEIFRRGTQLEDEQSLVV